MLSDIFFPFIDKSITNPIENYRTGLTILASVANKVHIVIPGHGSVGQDDQVQARIDLDLTYVQTLLHGHIPEDPRVGPEATFGKDWLPQMHQWQAQQLIGKYTGK